MKALPVVGRSSPTIILIVVDWPAPFGPRKPKNSPRRTTRLRQWRAVLPRKLLVSPQVAMAASGGGKAPGWKGAGCAAYAASAGGSGGKDGGVVIGSILYTGARSTSWSPTRRGQDTKQSGGRSAWPALLTRPLLTSRP